MFININKLNNKYVNSCIVIVCIIESYSCVIICVKVVNSDGIYYILTSTIY